MGIFFEAEIGIIMFRLPTIHPSDIPLFLLFVAFSGCFYLGVYLLWTGIKRTLQGRVAWNSAVLILLGIGLFFLCQLTFMGWYRYVL